MKKYIKLNLISGLIITLIFLIVSCQKDDSDILIQSDSVNQPQVYSEVFSSTSYNFFNPSESVADDLLEEFSDEIAADDVDSRSIREALWTLEAYLGYKLNNYEYVFDDIEFREEFIELDVDSSYGGDTILKGEDILQAYEDITDYEENDLAPLSIHFLDISYDSENNGVHKFKVKMMVGTKTGNSKGASLSHLNSGSYQVNGSGCTKNLGVAIEQSMNSYYFSGPSPYACSSGYRLVFSNVSIEQDDRLTSCCGGSTLGDELHVMITPSNNCIAYGNISDDGSNHTANGWINETEWVWDWEQNKLSGTDQVLGVDIVDDDFWVGSHPNYYIRYTHKLKFTTGTIMCITDSY